MWATTSPVIHPDSDPRHHSDNNLGNSDFLRRYARRLLRNARAAEPGQALPVLRRILATKVTPESNLTDLYAARASLQLKHVLHMLGRELGFTAWETCKHQIDASAPAVLDRYRLELGMFGDYQHNWFADMASARDWQKQHGGYLIEYGQQAVAILA